MVVATSYPFLNILGSMLIFFAWVVYIYMAIVVLIDVFRRRDIGGWAKAAWCVFVIVLPFIGVLSYLIVEHDRMAERGAQAAKQQQAQFDEYVKSVAGNGGGAADEIEKAQRLRDRGTITDAEFETLKQHALAAHH